MLDKLPPHSRIWVFQASRFLTLDEEKKVNEAMREFIPQWASHGNELYGDFSLEESLFLIVGADEQKSPTSGCSIDTLTRYIKNIGEQLGINFFDRLMLSYVDAEGKINLLTMFDFKALMKKDQITGSTIVFNNLITTKQELDTNWRTNVKNSWHKNLLEVL